MFTSVLRKVCRHLEGLWRYCNNRLNNESAWLEPRAFGLWGDSIYDKLCKVGNTNMPVMAKKQ